MKRHRISCDVGSALVALTLLLTIGCIGINPKQGVDVIADSLIMQYCDDCVLVKITEARYVKSTVNNSHNVLLVLDGVVEDAISKSTKEKLSVGASVRNVDLVDDEDLTQKLLVKMGDSDICAINLDYSYAFFNEVLSPDGVQSVPITGCFYPVLDCWLGSEAYDPKISMRESDIVEAFKRRALSSKKRNEDNHVKE